MLFSGLLVADLLMCAQAAVHTVSFAVDTPMWVVGSGVSYADLSVQLGDTLRFSSYQDHNVALLHTPSSGTHWEQCTQTGMSTNFTTIWSSSDFASGPVERFYMPPTCGDFYIACSVTPHCAFGQRVKVTVNNVDGTDCISPCADAACVTVDSKPSAPSGTVQNVMPVANSNFWGMNGAYDTLTIDIGDTVVFRTQPGFHDVSTVPTSDDFESCTMDSKTLLAEWDSSQEISTACTDMATCCSGSSCGAGADGMTVSYTWEAATAGEVHFVCSVGVGYHCRAGQKLSVIVSPSPSPVSTQQSSSSASALQTYFARVVVPVAIMLS